MCNTLDTLTVVLNMRVSGLVFAMCVLLFLFFKQKTAYEMRISDWSSDVCSSDLVRVRKCASLPGEAMTPPNILMVEDDPPIRTLTARALQEHGYIVRTAGTAPQMWDALRAAPADLLLLDIMLPGTSGLDLFREVRRTSDVPTIRSEERRVGKEWDSTCRC